MNSTTATPPTTMFNNNTTISEEEREEYLEGLNWGLMNELIPFLTIVILLLFAGLIGNCVIIAVYYKRNPSNLTRICVLTMGVVDLTTIIIAIPVGIMRVRWYFAYGPPTCVCRLIWGVFSTLVIFSSTILVIVAIVRKRVVMRRAARDTRSSLKKIKIILAAALGSSFFLSIPRFVIMGNSTLTFPGTDITGFRCEVEDQYETHTFVKVYNGILALCFISMCVAMNVSYVQIACFLYQHKKKRRQEKQSSGTGNKLRPKSEEAETSLNNIGNIHPESGPSVDYSTDSADSAQDTEDESRTVDTSTQMSELTSGAGEAVICSSPAGQETPEKRPSSKRPTSQASRRRSHRRSTRGPQGKKIPTGTTLMLFVLSVVVVVNYVPFLVVEMLKQRMPQLTEGIEKNVFFLLISSPYLNNVANPFVYSFCSNKFRDECRNLFGLKH